MGSPVSPPSIESHHSSATDKKTAITTRPRRCSINHCQGTCAKDQFVCPHLASKAAHVAHAAAKQHRLTKRASISFKDLQIGDELGHGAFCEVQEVKLNDQRFAMKRLRTKTMLRKSRFVRGASDLVVEAALLSNMDHENIIQVHGMSAGPIRDSVKNHEEGFFLVMDRLEMTLDEQIKKWRQEEMEADHNSHSTRMDRFWQRTEVALQIAKGLQYLHNEKIMVHRDLKPGNIGLDENGTVKLFDFGLSATLKDKGELLHQACGTPRYMAPEVLCKKPNGMKVDVYAFGLVLWELCSLEEVYPDFGNLMGKIARRGYRPPVQRWWPRTIQTLIRKCWCQIPEQRTCMNEVVSTLEGRLSLVKKK